MPSALNQCNFSIIMNDWSLHTFAFYILYYLLLHQTIFIFFTKINRFYGYFATDVVSIKFWYSTWSWICNHLPLFLSCCHTSRYRSSVFLLAFEAHENGSTSAPKMTPSPGHRLPDNVPWYLWTTNRCHRSVDLPIWTFYFLCFCASWCSISD